MAPSAYPPSPVRNAWRSCMRMGGPLLPFPVPLAMRFPSLPGHESKEFFASVPALVRTKRWPLGLAKVAQIRSHFFTRRAPTKRGAFILIKFPEGGFASAAILKQIQAVRVIQL